MVRSFIFSDMVFYYFVFHSRDLFDGVGFVLLVCVILGIVS